MQKQLVLFVFVLLFCIAAALHETTAVPKYKRGLLDKFSFGKKKQQRAKEQAAGAEGSSPVLASDSKPSSLSAAFGHNIGLRTADDMIAITLPPPPNYPPPRPPTLRESSTPQKPLPSLPEVAQTKDASSLIRNAGDLRSLSSVQPSSFHSTAFPNGRPPPPTRKAPLLPVSLPPPPPPPPPINRLSTDNKLETIDFDLDGGTSDVPFTLNPGSVPNDSIMEQHFFLDD